MSPFFIDSKVTGTDSTVIDRLIAEVGQHLRQHRGGGGLRRPADVGQAHDAAGRQDPRPRPRAPPALADQQAEHGDRPRPDVRSPREQRPSPGRRLASHFRCPPRKNLLTHW